MPRASLEPSRAATALNLERPTRDVHGLPNQVEPGATAPSTILGQRALDLATRSTATADYFMAGARMRPLQRKKGTPDDNRVDYHLANAWVQLHPEGRARRLATVLLQHVARLPEAGLQNRFYAMATRLRAEAQDGGAPLVGLHTLTARDDGSIALKSNDWALDAMDRELGHALQGRVHVRGDEVAAALTARVDGAPGGRLATAFPATGSKLGAWERWRGQRIRLVIVDDAAYSGDQLSGYVESSRLRAARAGVHLEAILVGVAAMTRFAHARVFGQGHGSRVDAAGSGDDGLKVESLCTPMRIDSVADFLEQLAKRDRGQSLSALRAQMLAAYPDSFDAGQTLESITLSYLPHKFPDYVSTLDVLRGGKVYSDGEELAFLSRPFIPPTTPPYKL